MPKAEPYTISQDCPHCGEEIAVPVEYEAHGKVPATAHYPGEPAHIDVWQVDTPTTCPQCGEAVTFDQLDETAAAIIADDLREARR